MLRALAVIIAVWAGGAFAVEVPSGKPVTLQEVLVDDVSSATWLRFRFIAPHVARANGDADLEETAADMQALCERLAIPYIRDYALEGEVIIISLADRETEFGAPNPEATQIFEAFRPVDNVCMWEGL